MGFLVTAGIRLLEAMFALGWAGTTVVLLLTAIEDVETLAEPDEPVKS
jgi:hypothetical protein